MTFQILGITQIKDTRKHLKIPMCWKLTINHYDKIIDQHDTILIYCKIVCIHLVTLETGTKHKSDILENSLYTLESGHNKSQIITAQF